MGYHWSFLRRWRCLHYENAVWRSRGLVLLRTFLIRTCSIYIIHSKRVLREVFVSRRSPPCLPMVYPVDSPVVSSMVFLARGMSSVALIWILCDSIWTLYYALSLLGFIVGRALLDVSPFLCSPSMSYSFGLATYIP